jgi:hypothetical protein
LDRVDGEDQPGTKELEMGRRKNWGAEQIIATLRQIEVQMAQGMGLAHACKGAAISEQNSRTSASSERSSTALWRLRS